MAYRTSGNLAYSWDAAPQRTPEVQRPQLRAVRAGGAHATQPQPRLLVTAAKMAAVVLVVVAALSFVRIILTNEAVTTMIESDALSTRIAEARSEGISLEMEQSVLSNPAAIKQQAGKLDMKAPSEVSTIALDPDVVAIEDGDTLSLSGTIKNVVDLQG